MNPLWLNVRCPKKRAEVACRRVEQYKNFELNAVRVVMRCSFFSLVIKVRTKLLQLLRAIKISQPGHHTVGYKKQKVKSVDDKSLPINNTLTFFSIFKG